MDQISEDMQVEQKDNIFHIDLNATSDMLLKNCFQSFLKREETYRKTHLQKEYGYAFDGYSYYGQQDSSNQAYDDLLETFVFSDFFPAKKYPSEFHPFLSGKWSELLKLVNSIESNIISKLGYEHVKEIHEQIGHMVSCNYYPPQSKFKHSAAENTRLSAHPDVSLITVFPFGMDGDLEYETPEGNWERLDQTDKMIAFPGYLMQLLTDGEIKALNHRVKLSENRNAERFSFAFFSLPFPDKTLQHTTNTSLSGKAYFEKYLRLFE